MIDSHYICWFDAIGLSDAPKVGGKNASLGELIRNLGPAGVRVPPGFAVTVEGYQNFLAANNLNAVITHAMAALQCGRITVEETGRTIRSAFLRSALPEALAEALRAAYRKLSQDHGAVAVRSSAVTEDLLGSRSARQHESFLNVVGEIELIEACRRCYASLFTDRAIAYRESCGSDPLQAALSIGVQQMVRSDLGGAGVMYTEDTAAGGGRTVRIDASWGLGESVVQQWVDVDEYEVCEPSPGAAPAVMRRKCGGKAMRVVYDSERGGTSRQATSAEERAAWVLDEGEILQLARWYRAIEHHYGTSVDIEWAKDGLTGELFIVQARPGMPAG